MAALSRNTQRAYDAQWRQWVTHAAAQGHPVLPASPATVAAWLAHRAGVIGDSRDGFLGEGRRPRRQSQEGRESGKEGAAAAHPVSLPTIRTAIAAVRLAHLAAGFTFDTNHPDIKLALRAAALADSRPAVQVRPLRSEMIQDLLATVGTSARDCRDAALLAVGYCFARRRSELVGLDFGRIGTGSGCLVLTTNTLELHLARSKSGARKAQVFVAPRSPNGAAVSAIERWIKIAGIAPEEPLFRRVYRSGRVSEARLDAQSVALIIKARVREHLMRQGVAGQRAAAEAERYAGHSLRVGFAVTAAEAGASVLAVQKALGHATPLMAARYARAADLARMSPHNLQGVALGRARPKRRKRRAQTGASP